MQRMFIEMPGFLTDWQGLGLSEDDLCDLEDHLLKHPEAGPVVRGTGGLRKLRWATKGKGKSGGARVIYLDLIVKKRTFLVTVYGKTTKEDMTDRERAELKKVVKLIVREER